jgi:hypothetical protein
MLQTFSQQGFGPNEVCDGGGGCLKSVTYSEFHGFRPRKGDFKQI